MGLQVDIDWKKLEKVPLQARAGILAGVVALIGGLFFYFMYLPEKQQLEREEGRLATVQREYNENKAIADNLATFQEEVDRLNERFEIALRKLPDTTEIDQILIDLPNLAREEELIVRTFRPGSDQPQDFYARVPLSLEVSGTYHQVARFFEKVGRLDRIINIGNISLSPTRGSGADVLDVSVNAQTYKFVERAQQPQTAQQQQRRRR